jgi:predicted DNA-binding mobile mystery protein A
MGVSGASVRSLEEKEITGGVRLSSLRRAAEAMDCTLVYAFIPAAGLEETVKRQAQWVLDEQVGRVRQTMALEEQDGEMLPSAREEQLRAVIGSRRLWSTWAKT